MRIIGRVMLSSMAFIPLGGIVGAPPDPSTERCAGEGQGDPPVLAPPRKAYRFSGRISHLRNTAPEELLSRQDLGGKELTGEEMELLRTVDGKLLELPAPGPEGRGAGLIVELPSFGMTCLRWSRIFFHGQGIHYWNGKLWIPLIKPRAKQNYDRAGAFKELTWIIDLPESTRSLYVKLDEGTKTDAISSRKAGSGEETDEALLDHGPEVGGLRLTTWLEEDHGPPAFVLLVDNRHPDRSIRRPFRSGRLSLVASCGDGRHEVGVDLPESVRAADIGPGGVTVETALSAWTHRFPVDSLLWEPEITGEYTLRFRYAQDEDGESKAGGAWAGTIESNPISRKLIGWIAASEAACIGHGTAPVRISSDPSTLSKGPKEGDYASGTWLYRVAYRAKGSRSEAVTGTLRYDGRIVRPKDAGQTIPTPFGILEYVGRPPARYGLFGEIPRGPSFGKSGWFPATGK